MSVQTIYPQPYQNPNTAIQSILAQDESHDPLGWESYYVRELAGIGQAIELSIASLANQALPEPSRVATQTILRRNKAVYPLAQILSEFDAGYPNEIFKGYIPLQEYIGAVNLEGIPAYIPGNVPSEQIRELQNAVGKALGSAQGLGIETPKNKPILIFVHEDYMTGVVDGVYFSDLNIAVISLRRNFAETISTTTHEVTHAVAIAKYGVPVIMTASESLALYLEEYHHGTHSMVERHIEKPYKDILSRIDVTKVPNVPLSIQELEGASDFDRKDIHPLLFTYIQGRLIGKIIFNAALRVTNDWNKARDIFMAYYKATCDQSLNQKLGRDTLYDDFEKKVNLIALAKMTTYVRDIGIKPLEMNDAMQEIYFEEVAKAKEKQEPHSA